MQHAQRYPSVWKQWPGLSLHAVQLDSLCLAHGLHACAKLPPTLQQERAIEGMQPVRAQTSVLLHMICGTHRWTLSAMPPVCTSHARCKLFRRPEQGSVHVQVVIPGALGLKDERPDRNDIETMITAGGGTVRLVAQGLRSHVDFAVVRPSIARSDANVQKLLKAKASWPHMGP